MTDAGGSRRRTAVLAALAVVVAVVVLLVVRGGSGGSSADDALGSSSSGVSATPATQGSAGPTASPTPKRTATGTTATRATSGTSATGTTGGGGAVAMPPPGGATYAPQPASTPAAHPGTAPLRLATVKTDPYLAPPGTAIERGTLQLSSAAPLDFDTDPVSRPVDISGAPMLRLHLTHDGSGDIPLTLSILDVAPDGTTVTLAQRPFVVPASTAAAGPASNADAVFSSIRHRLAAQHVLRLHLALGSLVDTVTIYYGALPGEAEGNSTNDQILRTEGGKNPSRIGIPVTKTEGAFVP